MGSAISIVLLESYYFVLTRKMIQILSCEEIMVHVSGILGLFIDILFYDLHRY